MNLILPTIFTEKNFAANSASIGFNFNSADKASQNENAKKILKAFFAQPGGQKNSDNEKYLFSTPTFQHSKEKVVIQFFFFKSISEKNTPLLADNSSFSKDLLMISGCLSQLFQKKVVIVPIKSQYPYMTRDIFRQYLSHNAMSNTTLNFQESVQAVLSLFKNNLPGYISGIKVMVSGRLVTETVIPRVTTKSFLFGSFQMVQEKNNHHFIDYAKFTTKNELGAFTVKVWISQRV